jgi:hypothetical protein
VIGICLQRAALYAICIAVALGARHVAAQPAPGGIIVPGAPVVTGFSGVRLGVTPLPPGVQPVDKTTIDINGPSLRVVDARSMGGPPSAQLVPAGKLLSIPAAQIGQVFAVALDDAVPPNIYAAATSAYGLPIVVPDTDGDGLPDRARGGGPNADFMLGLFGPHGGGPGTIWKISGASGEVSVFANVTLNGVPNSSPALGGLAFDPVSRQLFVADRDTGVIHAFRLDGQESGQFDHGVQGLGVVGLPPIPFDVRKRLDIRGPEFDATNPSTWAYAPPARRVFGLGVHRGRLYYAVAAGLRIWSVSIGPNGAFGADARVELAVPPGAVPGSEISKIIFDDTGAMLVAERGAPTGAYDFGALTAAETGRVLRFDAKPPDGSPFLWQPAGEYAIGFPPDHRNADGGIAIGHGFDPQGFINIGACGGTLWSTGSQLRISPEPELAQRLAAGGPLPVDGLQANAISLLRPQNAPPQSSYFIDYDDVTERTTTRGHVGDVAAWRFCPPGFYPQVAELLLEQTLCPIGTYFGGSRCLPAPCRPGEIYRAGHCEKPQCVPNRRDPNCCPPGTKWNPRTQTCD